MEKLRLREAGSAWSSGPVSTMGVGVGGGCLSRANRADQASRMLGLWLLSPSGHLGSSKLVQTMRGSGRQASPAADAQAASTCEKFVKRDERKGEEGKTGDCEHLARQPCQLPPRDGILSSGVLSRRPSPIPPSLPPLQCLKVRLGQR